MKVYNLSFCDHIYIVYVKYRVESPIGINAAKIRYTAQPS